MGEKSCCAELNSAYAQEHDTSSGPQGKDAPYGGSRPFQLPATNNRVHLHFGPKALSFFLDSNSDTVTAPTPETGNASSAAEHGGSPAFDVNLHGQLGSETLPPRQSSFHPNLSPLLVLVC
jgi:hypothetical protein